MDPSSHTFEWLASIPSVKAEPSVDTSLFYTHSSSSLPSQSLLLSEPRRPRSATTLSNNRVRPYPAPLKASRSDGTSDHTMPTGYSSGWSSPRMAVGRAGSDDDQYYRQYAAQHLSANFPDNASDHSDTRPSSSSGSGNAQSMFTGVVGPDMDLSRHGGDAFSMGAMNWPAQQQSSASLYADDLNFHSGATLAPSSAYTSHGGFDPTIPGSFPNRSPESISPPSTLPDNFTSYGSSLGGPDSPHSAASYMPGGAYSGGSVDLGREQLLERVRLLEARHEQQQAEIRNLSDALARRAGPGVPTPAFQREWQARTDARIRQFCALNRAGNALCAWHDSRRERRAYPPRMAPPGHLNCGCTYDEALFEESLARHGVGSYHPGESVRMDPALRNPLLQLLQERYGYRDGDFERDPRTGEWLEGEGAARWEQTGTPNRRPRVEAARR